MGGLHRDIAGHERFGCMTHVYYKYAMAALIVFDLTRPATFDAVLKVRGMLDATLTEPGDSYCRGLGASE